MEWGARKFSDGDPLVKRHLPRLNTSVVAVAKRSGPCVRGVSELEVYVQGSVRTNDRNVEGHNTTTCDLATLRPNPETNIDVRKGHLKSRRGAVGEARPTIIGNTAAREDDDGRRECDWNQITRTDPRRRGGAVAAVAEVTATRGVDEFPTCHLRGGNPSFRNFKS